MIFASSNSNEKADIENRYFFLWELHMYSAAGIEQEWKALFNITILKSSHVVEVATEQGCQGALMYSTCVHVPVHMQLYSLLRCCCVHSTSMHHWCWQCNRCVWGFVYECTESPPRGVTGGGAQSHLPHWETDGFSDNIIMLEISKASIHDPVLKATLTLWVYSSLLALPPITYHVYVC